MATLMKIKPLKKKRKGKEPENRNSIKCKLFAMSISPWLLQNVRNDSDVTFIWLYRSRNRFCWFQTHPEKKHFLLFSYNKWCGIDTACFGKTLCTDYIMTKNPWHSFSLSSLVINCLPRGRKRGSTWPDQPLYSFASSVIIKVCRQTIRCHVCNRITVIIFNKPIVMLDDWR